MLFHFILSYLLIEFLSGFPCKSKTLDIHIKNLRKNDELSDDIVIIHLNEVHCGIQEKVGYDCFVFNRDELKKKYKNVITVDVGDHVQGGSLVSISDGEAIIKIMNKIGFDVLTLGNHEFDYGTEQLDKLGKNSTTDYICSNFCNNKNKTCIFKPYKALNFDNNKKIGFIGVVTPLTFIKEHLEKVIVPQFINFSHQMIMNCIKLYKTILIL